MEGKWPQGEIGNIGKCLSNCFTLCLRSLTFVGAFNVNEEVGQAFCLMELLGMHGL